PAGKQTLILQT
ncbi:hypothetical protein LINPERHAP2_LOCUS30837, partial [Linum perenne]